MNSFICWPGQVICSTKVASIITRLYKELWSQNCFNNWLYKEVWSRKEVWGGRRGKIVSTTSLSSYWENISIRSSPEWELKYTDFVTEKWSPCSFGSRIANTDDFASRSWREKKQEKAEYEPLGRAWMTYLTPLDERWAPSPNGRSCRCDTLNRLPGKTCKEKQEPREKSESGKVFFLDC